MRVRNRSIVCLILVALTAIGVLGQVGDVETRVDAYVRGQIKGPTMIIHPDKDFLATEAETMEFFGKLRTNYKSYVALPDGG